MIRLAILFVLSAGLAGCSAIGQYFPDFEPTADTMSSSTAASMRSTSAPVMPGSPPTAATVDAGMLMACRGHVLIPAMGMTFVPVGGRVPAAGQFLREESLTPPYRVLPPGAMATQDYNPSRLNVDLDRNDRIINLRCG